MIYKFYQCIVDGAESLDRLVVLTFNETRRSGIVRVFVRPLQWFRLYVRIMIPLTDEDHDPLGVSKPQSITSTVRDLAPE